MTKYICEFLGTMILIILGNGAVCNHSLTKSSMKGSGAVLITLAWGFAVMIPAFIFKSHSLAIFNPALSIALMIDGTLPFNDCLIYIIAEILGAILGQIIVYFLYKNHFNETYESQTIASCFFTSPSIYSPLRNMTQEAIATFVLVFALKGINQASTTGGVSNIYIFGIVCACGMSFGGLTGYALNPARDLGPRIIHQILPIKHKGSSNWNYSFIPILGPILGAVFGVLLYSLLF